MVDRCRETMHHFHNASMFLFQKIAQSRYALSADNLEANQMPRKIVDLSARSRIIREEPWHLHFWESTAEEALAYLRNPRVELQSLGIELPADCRIETVVTNHDWMAEVTRGLTAESDNGPIIICNVGGGDVAINFYRVTMYAHREEDIGRHEKRLLHSEDEEAVQTN